MYYTTSGKFTPCLSDVTAYLVFDIKEPCEDDLTEAAARSMQQPLPLMLCVRVCVFNAVLGELHLICILHGVH